jgi:hypothetical protein
VAISKNYITLQRQIADECGDNQPLLTPLGDAVGLLSPIQNAIQSAISKWEREPFYFNDVRLMPVIGGPFNTVKGQEFYGAADYAPIATMATIKSLSVLIGSNNYTLAERGENYLEDISVNALNTGQPVDYSYSAQQLRLYPIPSGIYPMGITGTQRLSPLVNDNDTNGWTQDGFDLIRAEAKLILGREVIYDDNIANAAARAIYGDPGNPEERGYLYALKAETTRRHSSRTRVRPTYF